MPPGMTTRFLLSWPVLEEDASGAWLISATAPVIRCVLGDPRPECVCRGSWHLEGGKVHVILSP